MNNLKIYYINLKRSKNRDIFMQSQFKELGLNAIRVEAVDGKELDKKYIEDIISKLKLKNEHYTFPTPAEIGVYLSHKKIWEMVSNQKEKYALILEDDALIDEKLIKDLKNLLSLLNEGEILDISGLKGFLPIKRRKKGQIEVVQYLTPSLIIISTIFTKKAAKKLLETFNEYSVPVDNMLQQVYKHNLNVWITKDRYVKTNYKNLGGSTIQKQYKKSLKDKIKREILRPIYRVKIHIKNLIGYIKFIIR